MIEYYEIPDGRMVKILIKKSDNTVLPIEHYVGLIETAEEFIARSIKTVEGAGEELHKIIVTYRGTDLKKATIVSVTGFPCDASVYVNEKANDGTSLIKLEPKGL